MQRSELEAEIGQLLGDPQHERWPLSVIRPRIEFAQIEVQALTSAVRTTELLTPTADSNDVPIDTSVLDVVRVTFVQPDGIIIPLEGRRREDLDFYLPNWSNVGSGLPESFYFDGSTHYIVLYPAPSSTYAIANALRVVEVRVPSALTADDSLPFDSNVPMQPYSMSIVYWVVAQCWQDDGTPEALTKARYYRTGTLEEPGMYEKELKKINAKFNAPSIIPSRIMWRPEGGRIGGSNWPTKSNPLGW